MTLTQDLNDAQQSLAAAQAKVAAALEALKELQRLCESKNPEDLTRAKQIINTTIAVLG
ncbi:MAG: hypothetical protein ABIK65_15700 [Candidatus Eisenbacteria bacterium]